jgi:hypothetical protein
MPQYPGLGLPLRYEGKPYSGVYPVGSHGDYMNPEFEPIPVREVAMMYIMELLTDKEDWHRKILDDGIVAKWRNEALAIPDHDLWTIATYGKSQRSQVDGSVILENDWITTRTVLPLRGIMTANTFDCVSGFRCVISLV